MPEEAPSLELEKKITNKVGMSYFTSACNRREINSIIKTAILDAVRDSIPVACINVC